MSAKKKIGFNGIRNFLESLFEEYVHAMRVLSMANATLGVLSSASLAVHTIGQGLAHARRSEWPWIERSSITIIIQRSL
jgi:hypothetical protein